MPTDPERERHRLMDVYSRMVDGEIEQIAEDEASLTAVARQVLRDEIARRGLDHLLSDRDKSQDEAADATEPEPMVTIRSFGDVMQAWLAKSNLESSAIECNLVDDNMVRLHWGIVNVLGGVKLQVKREDAQVALELLEQPVPEQPDEDEP
jgi:regulator of protease activity HflC (stomatin/prohibitin superfamily)